MKIRNTVSGAACASISLVVGSFTASSASAQEAILFNCFWPAQHSICTSALPEMRRRIEDATDGRVTIEIPPNSLSAPFDQYDAVLDGVMDGAISYAPFISEASVGVQLSNVPFVGELNGVAGTMALWDTYEEYFNGVPGEFSSVEFLGVFLMAGANAHSLTDDPIISVEDIARRKIFSTPGDAAALARSTGAAVVTGPAVQMAEFITRGVVDGYLLGDWATVNDFKLGEYTRSRTTFQRALQQPPFAIYMNKDRFAQFSEEDQIAIKTALGRDYSVWVASLLDEELQVLALEYEGTIPVIQASEEFEADMVELSQPLVEAWIAKAEAIGVDGQAAIDSFHARYIAEIAALE